MTFRYISSMKPQDRSLVGYIVIVLGALGVFTGIAMTSNTSGPYDDSTSGLIVSAVGVAVCVMGYVIRLLEKIHQELAQTNSIIAKDG